MKENLSLFDSFIKEFCKIKNVEAILLSGSQVTVSTDKESDYDLYIYSSDEISVKDRRSIIEPFASYSEINNQFWETEDDWIMKDGTHIELIYRNWNWIREQLERVAINHEASIGYSTCFWANFTSSKILYDPTGKAKELKNTYDINYPENLRKNIICKNWSVLNVIIPSYYQQIEKALSRKDLVSVNHRIAAFIASWFDIIFAVNYSLHPGEKKLMDYVNINCDLVPENWYEDMKRLLQISYNDKKIILEIINKMIISLGNLLVNQHLIEKIDNK